jgi:dTMP kinase
MAEEFHFEVIDARKSPDEIQDALRSKIQPLLTTNLQSPALPSDRLIQPA